MIEALGQARRVGKVISPAMGPAETEHSIHDGDLASQGNADEDIVLHFEYGQLANRYVHGPAADQILTDEQITGTSTPGNVLWPLADNLGTIRDIAVSDGTTTTIVNHITYAAFGLATNEQNLADPTAEPADHIFGFTGRERDEESDLNLYRARYYDPAVARFISQDPIGFEAGDANLYRYVGNGPTSATDPSGLEARGEAWIHLEKVLERWGVRNYFQVHHVFHEQFYKDGEKLGQWLTKHGFARDTMDNLIALPGKRAPVAIMQCGRALHLGRHTRASVVALRTNLQAIRTAERTGRISAQEAAERIAKLQTAERLALRSGTRVLHRAGTIMKYLRFAGKGAMGMSPFGVALDVACGGSVADAAEIQWIEPERNDDDVVAVRLVRRKRIAFPDERGGYPDYGYGTTYGTDAVYTIMLRQQAELLDGLSTLTFKGTVRELTTIEVHIEGEYFRDVDYNK